MGWHADFALFGAVGRSGNGFGGEQGFRAVLGVHVDVVGLLLLVLLCVVLGRLGSGDEEVGLVCWLRGIVNCFLDREGFRRSLKSCWCGHGCGVLVCVDCLYRVAMR